MPARDADEILALAALFQALSEVRAIAHHGHGETRRMEPCLRGLLGKLQCGTAALYGGSAALKPGLRLAMDHLSRPAEPELTRYLVGVLHLERKLARNRRLLEQVIAGLARASAQAEYFSPLHDNVIHNLGDLYSETVSTIRPRLLIQGERNYLANPRNAALVRALLLAAIRAASLWRQAGGSRPRLIFGRKQLIDAAHRELATT